MNKKQGTVITNGVSLEKHEFRTVSFLSSHGFNIELIPPSQVKYSRTPDLKMCGLKWEMKAPKKNGKNTFDNIERKALRQSENIIFDLRRCRASESTTTARLKKDFQLAKRWKNLIIITQSANLLTYKK
jgi:hypothetical protein